MAQQPRKRQLVFAETAGTDEVGQVGSRAGGTPVTSKDLDVIQGNARFGQGWFQTAIRQTLTGGIQADLPASEDFNGLLLTLTSQLLYYFQNGVPAWLDDANERYYANVSFVQVNGDVYQALRGDDSGDLNVQQNPVTATDYWRLVYSRTSSSFYREITAATSIDLISGTPPRVIEITSGAPFTLTLNGVVGPAGTPLTILNNSSNIVTISGTSGLSGDILPSGALISVSASTRMVEQLDRTPSASRLIDTSAAVLAKTFWTIREIFPGTVISLTFGNGLFVAGTAGDTIWTSADGITWTQRQTVDGVVGALTFGNNTFVAGTTADTIWTSSDGITWTQQSQLFNGDIFSLTFGNGLFVAGTLDGVIWTSPDGITWTQRQTLDGDVESLTFGNNIFVAGTGVGIGPQGESVWTSSDGISWTEQQTLDGNVLSLLYAPVTSLGSSNRFIAGTELGTIYTSLDALTWTSEESLNGRIRSLASGNGVLIAGTGGAGDSLYSSSDSRNWTLIQQHNAEVRALIFGNNTFVGGVTSAIITPGA